MLFFKFCSVLSQTHSYFSSEGIVQHVTDFHDFAYFGNITLGDPQQQFLVVLDTGEARVLIRESILNLGSSSLWVPDNSCGSNSLYALSVLI